MASFDVIDDVPRPGVVRIALRGELDLHTAYAFDRRLLELEADHPDCIVIDLSQLSMLDSAGLARLVSAHRRARRDHRRVVFVRGGRIVQRVLSMTGLGEQLEVARDLDTALAPRERSRG